MMINGGTVPPRGKQRVMKGQDLKTQINRKHITSFRDVSISLYN
jgi:hypothetical protein